MKSSKISTLTIFTPTFNRANYLGRLYNSLLVQKCKDFEWLVIDDGSTDGTEELIRGFIQEGKIKIRYIYKENGGLYTGYNTAYANIESELSVCIDSDDFMPSDAVEIILDQWRERGSDSYAGIVGLDFYAGTDRPIGGWFPNHLIECTMTDLNDKSIHKGDTKQVMRTDLMKEVSPMKGFPGEKFFNPVYMLLQVCNRYPLLVVNRNLCFVDYNVGDNMSADIYGQYKQSPLSFAKLRELEMSLHTCTPKNRYRSAVHLVAEYLLARKPGRIFNNPYKLTSLLALLPGAVLYLFIKYKTSR